MGKLITIDYEEYLELEKYKEMIDEFNERIRIGSISWTEDFYIVRGASKIVEYIESKEGRKYKGLKIEKWN